MIQVVLDNKSALKECVQESLRRAPSKTGRVVIRWAIARSGETRNVDLVTKEHLDMPFSQCAVELIKRWKFPRHRIPGAPTEVPFRVGLPQPPCDGGHYCSEVSTH